MSQAAERPPSARRDTFTVPERAEIMRRVRSKNTKPELLLRRELTKRGFRYRVDYARAAGRPDIAMVVRRIAIFVDGEFWHGKKLSPERLAEMSEYWQRKIHRNVERDVRVNRELTDAGWTVIRVTDRAVLKDMEAVADFVQEVVTGDGPDARAPGLELYLP